MKIKDVGAYLALAPMLLYGWSNVRPPENDGALRFDPELATITVNVDAAHAWGDVDETVLTEWGVKIRFVHDDEANVTFKIGETSWRDVPGYGRAYVVAETRRYQDRDHWVSQCVITLSKSYQGSEQEATAVIAHEFGHCFGLQHVDQEHSVMGTVLDAGKFAYRPTSIDRQHIQQALEH